LAMVNVANRPDVAVRLRPLKLFLRHRFLPYRARNKKLRASRYCGYAVCARANFDIASHSFG
ncbi:hypothetical protein, partial [Microvirga aerophila]|uniref:hypothetical protein n=1 Tax=Microvirga aerophila TaxID=670291 RepID=UPI001AECE6B3